MKHLGYALLALASLAVPFLLESGCSKLLTQPNYGVPTAVPTGTWTSTKTATSTSTRTATGTPTVTSSPTITPTPGGPTNTPTVTFTVTNTLSPTPVPGGDTFNSSGSVANWPINTSNTTLSIQPASNTHFNSSYPNCSASVGSLEVTMGFDNSASGEKVVVSRDLGSATNLSGKSVTVILDITSGFSTAANVSAEIYLQQGGAAGAGSAYASLYANGSGTYLGSSSGCVTLSLAIPASATNTSTGTYNIFSGPFDPAVVQTLGLQFYGGGSPQNILTVDIKSWLYQ